MWPVVIVLLVIAMAVGPVMLMQPSKAQKRLAALRQEATKLGLTVGASPVKAPDGIVCWAYWLSMAEKNIHEPVMLERKNYEHGLHIAQYWSVKQGDSADLPTSVAEMLMLLPSSVHMLEVNEHAIGAHWSEQGGIKVLTEIAKTLRSIETKVS